ncbi:hypothetical protein COP2_045568 [Malus domestica]
MELSKVTLEIFTKLEQKSLSHCQTAKKTRILSIDAGSTTGIVVGATLIHLEDQIRPKTGDTHAQMVDFFDLITGTGIEAVLATMLIANDGSSRPLYTAALHALRGGSSLSSPQSVPAAASSRGVSTAAEAAAAAAIAVTKTGAQRRGQTIWVEDLQYVELQVLCLSSKVISGDLPDQLVSGLEGLQFLNSVEVLDLSSNLLDGTLPFDFGGENLCYLNIFYNKISGKFPVGFTKRVLENSIIDLSFNKLDRIDTRLAASIQ